MTFQDSKRTKQRKIRKSRAKKKTRAYIRKKEKQEAKERLMFSTDNIVTKKDKVNIVNLFDDINNAY